jgi:uncharacterized surface protein with fasciclin (FAS1) repeats
MLLRRVLSLALLAAALTACASAPCTVSIADTVSINPSLSTFNELIIRAKLTFTLQETGPFTVFVPSNDAFKLQPTQTLEDLKRNPEKLKNVLAFHIIPGQVMATQVRIKSTPTLTGTNVALSKAADFLTIEDALVEKADIQARNGIIHIIDSVLNPPNKK